MARKRVTYRPSKSGSAFGGIVGIIFVCIGLFVVIPASSMAGGFAMIFGILWTAIAAGITVMNFYQAFSKRYTGPEIHIEEEGPAEGPASAAPPAGESRDTQSRLTELRQLYDQRLITQEEYEAKRAEILKEL